MKPTYSARRGPYAASSLCALVILALAPSTVLAGAWTRPAGGTYVKVWNRSLIGSAAFGVEGDRRDMGQTYIDQALHVYAEYGLMDRLTLTGFALPAGYASVEDGDSAFYVGPIDLGLRYGLVQGGPWAVSVEGQYGYAPEIGDEALASGVADGEAWVYVPTVSTQRFAGVASVGRGLSFGWTAFSVGVRGFSEDGLDPAITGFGQLGWNPNASWTLDLHLNVNEPLGDVEIANVAGAGQTRYFGYGFGASWWATRHFGVNAGLEGVAYAESNASTPTITLGVEYRNDD